METWSLSMGDRFFLLRWSSHRLETNSHAFLLQDCALLGALSGKSQPKPWLLAGCCQLDSFPPSLSVPRAGQMPLLHISRVPCSPLPGSHPHTLWPWVIFPAFPGQNGMLGRRQKNSFSSAPQKGFLWVQNPTLEATNQRWKRCGRGIDNSGCYIIT